MFRNLLITGFVMAITSKTVSFSCLRNNIHCDNVSDFKKHNIFNQAAIAMPAQANQLPRSVLQLLR